MKLVEIERQLREVLPDINTRFSEFLSVDSYIVLSGVATITTSTAHDLNVGDDVNIIGVVYPNPIITLTAAFGVATLETIVPFDQNNLRLFPEIEVDGAVEPDYNGVFKALAYQTRKIASYEVKLLTPSTATGSPVLLERNLTRYNGVFKVVSTPTTTTFTVDVVDIADFTSLLGVTVSPLKEHRIAAQVDDRQLMDNFTDKEIDKWWLFIIVDDASIVSKDRGIGVDFNTRVQTGEEYKQQTEENFTILVFVPISEEITAVEAQDECRNETRRDLIASLGYFVPDKLFTNKYSAIFYKSDQAFGNNSATYVHRYDFATTVDIVTSDTYIPPSIAINEIETTYVDDERSEQVNAVDKIDYKTRGD